MYTVYIYYIHTEKYSQKSYLINFHTEMSSSQSEERTMFFICEKKWYLKSELQMMFFHVWEKWYVQLELTEVCESYAKIPAFYRRLQCPHFASASQTFNKKSFSQRVFLIKKWKTSWKLEWNSFVYFSVNEGNCREQAKQQQRGKTERDITLSCAFYRSYLSSYLIIHIGHFT